MPLMGASRAIGAMSRGRYQEALSAVDNTVLGLKHLYDSAMHGLDGFMQKNNLGHLNPTRQFTEGAESLESALVAQRQRSPVIDAVDPFGYSNARSPISFHLVPLSRTFSQRMLQRLDPVRTFKQRMNQIDNTVGRIVMGNLVGIDEYWRQMASKLELRLQLQQQYTEKAMKKLAARHGPLPPSSEVLLPGILQKNASKYADRKMGLYINDGVIQSDEAIIIRSMTEVLPEEGATTRQTAQKQQEWSKQQKAQQDPSVMASTRNASKRATFVEDLEGHNKTIDDLLNYIPGAVIFTPFNRIAINTLRWGLGYSPASVPSVMSDVIHRFRHRLGKHSYHRLSESWKKLKDLDADTNKQYAPVKDLRRRLRSTDNRDVDLAYGQAVVGSALFAGFSGLYFNGWLRGPGPKDPRGRSSDYGFAQPNSFGPTGPGAWSIPFSPFAPVSLAASAVSSVCDVLTGKSWTDSESDTIINACILALGEVITHQPAAQGFSEFLGLVTSGQPASNQKAWSRLFSNPVPNVVTRGAAIKGAPLASGTRPFVRLSEEGATGDAARKVGMPYDAKYNTLGEKVKPRQSATGPLNLIMPGFLTYNEKDPTYVKLYKIDPRFVTLQTNYTRVGYDLRDVPHQSVVAGNKQTFIAEHIDPETYILREDYVPPPGKSAWDQWNTYLSKTAVPLTGKGSPGYALGKDYQGTAARVFGKSGPLTFKQALTKLVNDKGFVDDTLTSQEEMLDNLRGVYTTVADHLTKSNNVVLFLQFHATRFEDLTSRISDREKDLKTETDPQRVTELNNELLALKEARRNRGMEKLDKTNTPIMLKAYENLERQAKNDFPGQSNDR